VKTEEKAVVDKQKQDATETGKQGTIPVVDSGVRGNVWECGVRGGVWDPHLEVCRSKMFYEKQEFKNAVPWVAVGLVSVGLLVLLIRR
jgi:hypothetical protein